MSPLCGVLRYHGIQRYGLAKKPEKITNMFQSLSPTIEKVGVSAKEWLKNQTNELVNKDINGSFPIVFPISFSDSIILISNNNSILSAIFMLSNVEQIFSAAIDARIPMKGAIAYGEMTAEIKKDWPLYFGQPLIDAYELHKELQLYGVVLHHTMEQYLKKIRMIGTTKDVKSIIMYPLPMKFGNINHYTIDWTLDLGKNKDPVELVSNLYNNVSGEPRKYVDNTLEFISWITDRKAELAKK
jgi:hypothetical protein